MIVSHKHMALPKNNCHFSGLLYKAQMVLDVLQQLDGAYLIIQFAATLKMNDTVDNAKKLELKASSFVTENWAGLC